MTFTISFDYSISLLLSLNRHKNKERATSDGWLVQGDDDNGDDDNGDDDNKQNRNENRKQTTRELFVLDVHTYVRTYTHTYIPMKKIQTCDKPNKNETRHSNKDNQQTIRSIRRLTTKHFND